MLEKILKRQDWEQKSVRAGELLLHHCSTENQTILTPTLGCAEKQKSSQKYIMHLKIKQRYSCNGGLIKVAFHQQVCFTQRSRETEVLLAETSYRQSTEKYAINVLCSDKQIITPRVSPEACCLVAKLRRCMIA